jgi:hypothetical protein
VQPSVPICAWYGVHCSGENVTSIALSSNNLAATLPLAPPTTLVALNLSNNNVAGTLPPSCVVLRAVHPSSPKGAQPPSPRASR